MAKRKQESPDTLKQIATGLVQSARQDIELAVEQLRGAASNVLEKVADAKTQPPERQTHKSAKQFARRKSTTRTKSRTVKRRKSTTATKRGKRKH
jgi:hypothetical protein